MRLEIAHLIEVGRPGPEFADLAGCLGINDGDRQPRRVLRVLDVPVPGGAQDHRLAEPAVLPETHDQQMTLRAAAEPGECLAQHGPCTGIVHVENLEMESVAVLAGDLVLAHDRGQVEVSNLQHAREGAGPCALA